VTHPLMDIEQQIVVPGAFRQRSVVAHRHETGHHLLGQVAQFDVGLLEIATAADQRRAGASMPRFVAATDAISTIDDRPNLLDLTPTEFETHPESVTSMGLEAKQTPRFQRRRGGLRRLRYAADLGGKVVIQAKRYKNTVTFRQVEIFSDPSE
jgi:hypothetical protein